ncbi:histone-lysine N-methyltransferase EHMT1, partial [Nematolebias whitei]|uniref:histone-lysine N-methyltransferase EHMT1 n=1 Tax=Nematolebias whitei TaxID=451745 RepID=UPI001899A7AE
MDYTGAYQSLSPGGRSFSPASKVPCVSKGQGAQPSPRSRLTVTPFHNSSIVMNDAALRSKGLGSVPTVDHHTSEREGDLSPPITTAGSVENSSSSLTQMEARPVGKYVGNKAPQSDEMGTLTSGPSSNSEPAHNQDDDKRNRVYSFVKAQTAVKKKKRKMGMYNLVPKRKTKTVKQEKKEEAKAGMGTSQAAKGPSTVQPNTEKAVEQAGSKEELLVEGVESVDYTEVALDCLDLKAQEELLSPPRSGMAGDAEGEEADMAEELPLCCCRMETPNSGGSPSTLGLVCMATDSSDGMLRYCQRPVIKQEMMRPSNMVQLLLLCEDHRAGMVKHQCCPGCGVFCRVGSFMECRPYGSISHRFHRECASILKDRIFCPHCGEDANGATNVTVSISKPDPSPSVLRSNPGPALPVVATLPLVPTTPAVPQILRAKKSSEPRRSRDLSLSRPKGEGAHFADRHPKESLESILVSLDDVNLKVKKVKFPARQLYVSAKQGDLTRVIQLLVDGKDPNLLIEGQNKRTPLHAASAEGHQEICHMLVQAGANLDMFDVEHRTPLMAACENNQLDTVCYLLRAGAAIGHKDLRGFTCLHLAAKLGHYDLISHLLTKASKHINCQDDGGWTPITWAIEHKHTEVVRLLLNKGADVNIKDKEDRK